MARSAATMLTSVPVSTIVAARQAASTAIARGDSHDRTLTWPSPAWCPIAGFMIHSTIPPSTEVSSQLNSAHDVLQLVASSTPSTGPIMNEISMTTASIDSAVLRISSGTACMSACRTIENDGMTNSPPTAASATSGQ